MMEKRHFIAIARVFVDIRPKMLRQGDPSDLTWMARMQQWRTNVNAMADMLQLQNARFNYNRFRIACDE